MIYESLFKLENTFDNVAFSEDVEKYRRPLKYLYKITSIGPLFAFYPLLGLVFLIGGTIFKAGKAALGYADPAGGKSDFGPPFRFILAAICIGLVLLMVHSALDEVVPPEDKGKG
jgi:hypothetical protein